MNDISLRKTTMGRLAEKRAAVGKYCFILQMHCFRDNLFDYNNYYRYNAVYVDNTNDQDASISAIFNHSSAGMSL